MRCARVERSNVPEPRDADAGVGFYRMSKLALDVEKFMFKVDVKLFRRLSEKRPTGCKFGKLHADLNSFAPRQHFSNRKEDLVP